jgi:hypothetical protein
VTIQQVQSVTGYKSDRMTEWYSLFDPNEFSEVRKAQEVLLCPAEKATAKRKPEWKTKRSVRQQPLGLVKPDIRKPGDNIIQMSEPKTERARKQA